MTTIQCPNCRHMIYKSPAPRRRPFDPSALVDLPELDEGDQWLTTEQVSEKFGYKRGTLTGLISRNKFPRAEVKWRGRNYWRLSTVQRWWEESRQVLVMPSDGWPEVEPSQVPPRGKGGRFVKISKVEITFES